MSEHVYEWLPYIALVLGVVLVSLWVDRVSR